MQKFAHVIGIAAVVAGSMLAKPVAALTFDSGTNSFTIDTSSQSDVGQSIRVDFNGFIDEQLTNGLTAEALFTVLGVDDTNNTLELQIDLTNTSSIPITNSRVSILGFDTDSSPTNVTSSGLFTQVTSGNPPQTVVGNVENCFKAGGSSNCQGGGNGGLSLGNTGTFFPTFSYASLPSSVTLDNFFVRYQSIEGDNLVDASGVGVGRVPTPALLPSFVGFAAALRKRRKRLPTTTS